MRATLMMRTGTFYVGMCVCVAIKISYKNILYSATDLGGRSSLVRRVQHSQGPADTGTADFKLLLSHSCLKSANQPPPNELLPSQSARRYHGNSRPPAPTHPRITR